MVRTNDFTMFFSLGKGFSSLPSCSFLNARTELGKFFLIIFASVRDCVSRVYVIMNKYTSSMFGCQEENTNLFERSNHELFSLRRRSGAHGCIL